MIHQLGMPSTVKDYATGKVRLFTEQEKKETRTNRRTHIENQLFALQELTENFADQEEWDGDQTEAVFMRRAHYMIKQALTTIIKEDK